MRRLATCVLLLLLAAFSAPALARAAEIREGVPGSPFRLADTGGLLVNNPSGDQSLVPPFDATTINGTSWEFEPRSVRQDSRDGSFLVACGKHGYVQRVMADGKKGALYTAAQIPGLERPFDAFPMPDGGMMIVDRGAAAGEGRVIRVDASNREVWRFGGTTGLGAGQVWDPFTAEPLGNGHTLIADSLGFRIIEVDDATGAIVWSYGTFNVSGPGPGLLIRPHSAQRLPNGNTLICDADGHTVLEVTPAGQKVWSYGTGAPGSGPNQLFNPNSARRTADGKETIISDSDNNRVLVVDSGGNVLHEYAGAVSNPRAALRLADGTTMVADLGNMSLQRYGFRVGSEYVATSALHQSCRGKAEVVHQAGCERVAAAGTLLKTEYTTDNKSWKVVPPDGVLPATATGDTIRYRLHLITDDWKLAPTVNDVTITGRYSCRSRSRARRAQPRRRRAAQRAAGRDPPARGRVSASVRSA